jgi:CubicO group peptidase (beta-lactamase class C family)
MNAKWQLLPKYALRLRANAFNDAGRAMLVKLAASLPCLDKSRMQFSSRALTLLFISLVSFAATGAAQANEPVGGTAMVNRFAAVDAILAKAVQEQNPPGVVVIVGHNGETVYRKAFGYRSLEPQREPMTMDTIFDMASLTKCMVTATGIMQLVQAGQVRLNDPVAR